MQPSSNQNARWVIFVLIVLSCSGAPARVEAQSDEIESERIPVSQLEEQASVDRRWQQNESDNRVEGIRNRIDIIKDLLARQKAEAEAAKRAAEIAAKEKQQKQPVTPPTPTPPPVAPVQLEPPLEVTPNVPVHTPATENPAADSVEKPAHTPAATDASPSSDPVGVQVISTPVNSFELANSLFATGNYPQALKSYEALLAEPDSADEQDWLKCLAAGCYRIQGDIPRAESLYRDVAASKNNGYPSDYSKWFLDHLTRRKRIETELRNINAELQSYVSSGDSK